MANKKNFKNKLLIIDLKLQDKNYTILLMIDIIFLALIFYFVIAGLQKGFLSYFLEFLLVLICVFGALLYYRETHNFLHSLIILFFSPILLAIIFRFLFHVSIAKTQHIKWLILTHLNNIGGGVIGFIWGIFWTIIIAAVINIIPINNTGLIEFKENVSRSSVLNFIKTMVPIKEVFLVDKINNLCEVMNNPDTIKNLKNNPAFQKLMEEEKIKDFIRDRAVMNQLKDRQILSLLDNPRFVAILEDLQLLKEFMRIDFGSMLEYKDSNQKD